MDSNLYYVNSDDENETTDLQIRYNIIREELYDSMRKNAGLANFIDKLRSNTINDKYEDRFSKVIFFTLFTLF